MSGASDNLTPEGKKFYDLLRDLANVEIHVGYQDSDTYEDGVTLAEVAMANEVGTDTIPARPFLAQSVDNNRDIIQEFCEEQITKMVNESISAQKGFEAIGAFQKGLIQAEIVDGDFVENAESTVLKKGSSQPLIDTGRMRQSVQFVVTKGGG